MANRVCPVWIGYLLLSPFRKLGQNPVKILAPFLKPGMTVMDFGSAMGYFSIPMANMIKPDGKVVCVDIQQKMLDALMRRAEKFGVRDLTEPCLSTSKSFNLEKYKDQIDFILAFAVVHEVPDKEKLFKEFNLVLKTDGLILFAEPSGHVSESDFQKSIKTAVENGLTPIETSNIKRSRTILLKKV